MSEPSLNEVRDEYMFATQEVDMDGYVIVSSQEAYAQFDAALAAHDREVKAEARAVIAAQHPRCDEPCEMCAEMDDWLHALDQWIESQETP